MKLVVWNEEDEPWDAIVDSYGDIIFYDDPIMGNYEVGDQIQYQTEDCVGCYIVVDVEPTSPFDGWGKQVTVRLIDS